MSDTIPPGIHPPPSKSEALTHEAARLCEQLLAEIESFVVPEEEVARQQKLRERIFGRLDATVRWCEMHALPVEELEAVKSAPMHHARIAKILAWMDELAEGKACTPEGVEEAELLDRFTEVSEALGAITALREGRRLSQEAYDLFECPAFYSRIVDAVTRTTNATTGSHHFVDPPLEDNRAWVDASIALCGIGTTEAMRLRERWLQMDDYRSQVVFSLVGVDTEPSRQLGVRAAKLSEEWCAEHMSSRTFATVRGSIAYLTGIDTQEAMRIRLDALDHARTRLANVVGSLNGLCSPASITMRKLCIEMATPQQRAGIWGAIIGGLAGIDAPWAMELRQLAVPHISPKILRVSLRWLSSPEAEAMRESLACLRHEEDYTNLDKPSGTAISLYGVGTPESVELRRRILRRGATVLEVGESLCGADTPEAWELRDELVDMYGSTPALLSSVRGVNSERADCLRKELLDKLTKDGLASAYREYIAKSVVGVYTPASFEIRQKYLSEPSDWIRSLGADDELEKLYFLRRAADEVVEAST